MSESAIEVLRRMLDEHGVKWWSSRYGEQVVFQVGEVKWFADDGCRDGMLELSTIAITPEQAIAATLGSMSTTVDDVLSLLDEMNEQGRIEYADYSQLHDAIAATLGSVDKGIPQGADGNLDQSQVDWLRLMPDGWDGTPPTLGGGKLTAEQVLDAIERNFGKVAVIDDGDDKVEWREGWVCNVGINSRAIADELNSVLGGGDSSADDALALLDEIREADRIPYDDYSRLFDAIATLGGGECKWVWVESWTDTTDGRECDYAHWMPDCGCWSEYDHRFSDFDDYAEKPTGIAFCERCGKAVKR